MFTPFVRFVLLILCGVLAVVFAWAGSVPLMLLCSIASVLLLWGYRNYGTVMLALRKLKKEDFEAAEKILALTNVPDKLGKKPRAYFYFVQGFIAREKNKFAEAEPLLLRAVAEGIKNEHDRSMALLALADMQLIKQRKDLARDYLYQMKGLKVQPSLMPTIRRVQDWVGGI